MLNLLFGVALGVALTLGFAVWLGRRRKYHSKEGRRLGANSLAVTKENIVSVVRRGGSRDAHTQVH